jgi:DinB superfamily
MRPEPMNMQTVQELIDQVAVARRRLLDTVSNLTTAQAVFKPAAEQWSVLENIEHVVLAEISGVSKIWQAADSFREGTRVFTGEHTNHGLSIDEVVARTWKTREIAPPIATPHIGGPLQYWITYCDSCQSVLERLGTELHGLDLEQVIFPHFLSGPLDARQRLEFLRFHLDRHRAQILRLFDHESFPGAPRRSSASAVSS